MGLLKTELEKVKEEKEGFEFKIVKIEKSSKDLDQLLASQITDKSKKGFGYNVVPSPHPLILNRPTPLDLSYSESDNSKENTDDSLKQQHKTVIETSSVKSPLKMTRRRQNVNTARARGFNAVKPLACWVLRPIKPNGASLVFNKYNYIDARGKSKGGARHMSGNISPSLDFKDFVGYVNFCGSEQMEEELLAKVQQRKKGIFISQDKYVHEILRKFNYSDVKSASTPTDLEKPLVKDGDADDVDEHLYRSMIGSLMYLTSQTRYHVCTTLDRKSTTGGCQFLGNRLISWQCKKQTVVSTSTTEAEYVAAASCCGQIIDFLNRSHIYYALTKKPKVCVSFIKQFWRSAEASTDDNGEVKINATIDGHSLSITEGSLRRHLKLADQDGITSIPNSEIFEQLALMGYHTDSDKVKKLEARVKIGKAKRQARVVFSDDEVFEDDFSKNRGGSTASEEVPIVSTAEVNLSTAGGTVTYSRRSAEKRSRQDKGKAIMIEEEPKKKSKKELEQERLSYAEAIRLEEQMNEEQRAQIARDEEIARQWDEEERQRAMDEAKSAKKIDWNDPSVIRYHTQKLKPKTVAQARRNMIKYLKNQGNYKISDFKGIPVEGEEVDTQEELKEVVKEPGAKRKKSIPRKSTRKRQKLEEDAEKEELKGFLDIIPREEVPIEYSEEMAVQKNYKILSEMLEDFDRQDVEELYRLVKERYSTSRPEGFDLMLWGDLHTLFEPDEDDEIWKDQHEYNLLSWRLCDFCGIHILLMENGLAIHMLTEKKYPLSQEMLTKMLSRKLEFWDNWDSCGAAVVVVRGWCRRWYDDDDDDDDDDGGGCDGVKVRVVIAYGGVGYGVVVRRQRRW
ncbi:hypothetical protein Tco_0806739 [Tanacetum coccineum]